MLTGSDTHLNLATSEGGRFGEPIRLDCAAVVSPALPTFESTVVLAWTGTDQDLNLAIGLAGRETSV